MCIYIYIYTYVYIKRIRKEHRSELINKMIVNRKRAQIKMIMIMIKDTYGHFSYEELSDQESLSQNSEITALRN